MPDSGYIKRKKGGKERSGRIRGTNLRTGTGQRTGQRTSLPAAGEFRLQGLVCGYPHPISKKPLNVLTLDSPSAYTMRNLSRIYTKKTGVPVNITIYSYEEIYEPSTICIMILSLMCCAWT